MNIKIKCPKLREIKIALKALFTKPYTTKFPFSVHIPFSSFRGKPYYDREKCIGCLACVNVCPAKALSYQDVIEHKVRILKVNWDICIECGQCQLHCPTNKGIMLSNEFDLSVLKEKNDLNQTIKKELVLCERCKKIVGCYDHLVWTIKKLGPLYTTNTTLINFEQIRLNLSDDIFFNQEKLRSQRFGILCSYCKREIVSIS